MGLCFKLNRMQVPVIIIRTITRTLFINSF
uniref:Uncharacterized protein n=1 Tax=Anguilla anguilla TaxID=7936 RepID=A0A0E9PRF4_ANGAN